MNSDLSFARAPLRSRRRISGIRLQISDWLLNARIGLRKSVRCGFNPRHERLYRLWNITLALFVGVLAVAPMAVVAILILITSGRPIFYSGVRYGRGRKEFHIYKFRTLLVDAETAVGDSTVKDSSDLVTPIGKFLRQTRLDELPQIWNVIRGDMNFVGPRPVRPVIAAKYEESIPNYNRRFDVRPGIIGHVQIFMPHGAPKHIRARYNNILVKRDVNILGEIYMIFFTVFRMLYLVSRPVMRRLRRGVPAGLVPTIEFDGSKERKPDKNLAVRITPAGELVVLWDGKKPLKVKGTRIVFSKKNHLNAEVRVPVSLSKSHKKAANGTQLFEVRPKTPVGQFLIERHVLSKTFAS